MIMSLAGELRLLPIPFADEIAPGDALAERLLHSLRAKRLSLRQGDILVIKHKIVSKAEGGMVDLATIRPSEDSVSWAQKYGLDARVVARAPGSRSEGAGAWPAARMACSSPRGAMASSALTAAWMCRTWMAAATHY